MKTVSVVVTAALLVTPALRAEVRLAAAGGEAAMRGAELLGRVVGANEARAAALGSYRCRRRYAVLEHDHRPDAEMVVAMRFVSPSTKRFTTVSADGVGWISRRVFRGLMHAEQEAAAGREQAASAISPVNYDARFLGTDTYRGRDTYVLALTPKRRDKYLFVGRVWIDQQDLAVARIEGEPARSPSFWVVRAPFVREYQRIGRFWLPLRDETHSQIRFAGEYILQIDYDDYDIARTR